MTTLASIIPTIGRKSVYNTLNSVFTDNFCPGDQCIMVCDGCEVPSVSPEVTILKRSQPGNDYGVQARNMALEVVTTDLITYMDDDDEYIPGSWKHIRNADSKSLNIFKMAYHNLGKKPRRCLEYNCLFTSREHLIKECQLRDSGPRQPYVLDFEYDIPVGDYEVLGHDERSLFGYLAISEGFASARCALTDKKIQPTTTSSFVPGLIRIIKTLPAGTYYVAGHRGLMYTPFGFLAFQGGYGEVLDFRDYRKKFDYLNIRDGTKVLWKTMDLVLGNISSQMLIVPGSTKTLWRGKHFSLDFDYAKTVANEYGTISWQQDLICIKNPAGKMRA